MCPPFFLQKYTRETNLILSEDQATIQIGEMHNLTIAFFQNMIFFEPAEK